MQIIDSFVTLQLIDLLKEFNLPEFYIEKYVHIFYINIRYRSDISPKNYQIIEDFI